MQRDTIGGKGLKHFYPVQGQRKSAQLWKQAQGKKLRFFQMLILCGKSPAVCLLACLSRVIWFLTRSHSATQRLISATANTSGRHVPHTSSLFVLPPPPPPLSTLFLFLLITNTCRPCFHQLRPSRQSAALLLFLLSSALWHVGRFIRPNKEPQLWALWRWRVLSLARKM